jgi:flagellin
VNIYGGLDILNTLYKTRKDMDTLITRLSTGKMINTAADDPTGVVISTRLEAQINQNKITNENISRGKAILESINVALSSVTDIFTSINELAIEAESDSLSASERDTLEEEVMALWNTYLDLVDNHNYDGVNYLNDDFNKVNINTGLNNFSFFAPDISLYGDEAISYWGSSSNFMQNSGQARYVQNVIQYNLGIMEKLIPRYGAMPNTLSIIEDHQLKNQVLLEKRYASLMDVDTAKTTSDLAKLQLMEETNIMLLQMQSERNSSFLQLLSF